MEVDPSAPSSPPPPALPKRQRQFPCKNCGANLVFSPGAQAMECPYCGTVNDVPSTADAAVEELDLRTYLATAPPEEVADVILVHCNTCGAETTLDPHVTAQRCPFCGSGIVAQGLSKRVIKPRSLLPFRVPHDEASRCFHRWLGGLWFAPNDLLKQARRHDIAGVYIPAWTYDADTTSHYTGERGEHYYVTQTYTTIVNGKSVTRTRQVRKTRWYSARGTVHSRFDDLLVLASRSLPERLGHKLEPWDLKALVPYRDEFLAGFRAESYQVDLAEGFGVARAMMVEPIRRTILYDIGGDEQRIHSVDTRYFNTTFKHVLLPIWISAYRYQDRAYRFLVNARTGEVQGERPWSVVKIVLAVLVGILVALVIVLVVARSQ